MNRIIFSENCQKKYVPSNASTRKILSSIKVIHFIMFESCTLFENSIAFSEITMLIVTLQCTYTSVSFFIFISQQTARLTLILLDSPRALKNFEMTTTERFFCLRRFSTCHTRSTPTLALTVFITSSSKSPKQCNFQFQTARSRFIQKTKFSNDE